MEQRKLVYISSIFIAILIIAGILLILLPDMSAKHLAQSHNESVNDTIEFYYTDTCQHCNNVKPFLESIEKNYTHVKIIRYNVINSSIALDRMLQLDAEHNIDITSSAVPQIYVRDQIIIGDQKIFDELEKILNQ